MFSAYTRKSVRRALGGFALFGLLLLMTNRQLGTKRADMTTRVPNEPANLEAGGGLNHLRGEKSPYLLQHVANPVDWYPWGEQAFAKAKREDKPLFLSIGYSTCHWCHVMEHESFENAAVARLMNEHFVSIKVDREERPDIDHIYISAVQAMTGSGGWPLSVFLTGDLKPFYGGTYFPPEPRWGQPGFKNVLEGVAEAWKTRRNEITGSADHFTNALRGYLAPPSGDPSLPDEKVFQKAFEQLQSTFDSRYGGFGQAPKFPRSHELSFLLRYGRRTATPEAWAMVETTLAQMARGGLCDQLGGGFHRYSTDERWFLPHFEKMLYDQAILAITYLEAYQATGRTFYAEVADRTFGYVLRDMRDAHGGFYSAEDADSLPPDAWAERPGLIDGPGKKWEGAFYLWPYQELMRVAGERDGSVFCFRYGVEEKGNVADDPHGEFQGKNILYEAHTLEETADRFKLSADETRAVLERVCARLFEFRTGRPRPHRDDKILTDWNGLMIGSLAQGARVLEKPAYAAAASDAAHFVLAHMQTSDGELLHRYRDGEAAIAGMLQDYAFFIDGLLDLYEATFEWRWLVEGQRLTRQMLRIFWDEKEGGFFNTAAGAPHVLVRAKELYDGAVPSGNSVAARLLLRLGRLSDDREFEDKAEAMLNGFYAQVEASPTAHTQWLSALDFKAGPSYEIVLVGDREAADLKTLLRTLDRSFVPNKVVLLKTKMRLPADAPSFLLDKVKINQRATVYVCQNRACRLPTNDPAVFAAQLKAG